MLDIQGQPTQAVPPPTYSIPRSTAAISSVGGGSTRTSMVALLLMVASVVVAGGYLSFVRTNQQSRIATRSREIDELKRQLGTPEQVQAASTTDQLTRSIATLQGVLGKSSPWSPLLTAIAERTPKGVTLVNFSVDEQFAVRFNGLADSYRDLSTLLAALAHSKQFAQVVLESSAVNESTTGSSVSFAVKGQYQPPVTVQPTSTTSEDHGTE